jgi:excinuclease ABC subunit C
MPVSFKVCLEYQLGNCKGPCQNYQSEDDYDNSIEEIKDILNGKIGAVVRKLQSELNNAIAAMNYELAHRLKRKFDLLENYQSKSTVVNSSITDVDVFSIASEEKNRLRKLFKGNEWHHHSNPNY